MKLMPTCSGSANDTNSTDDLASIQNEVTQRVAEINRISAQTQFNSVYVLAKMQSITLQLAPIMAILSTLT